MTVLGGSKGAGVTLEVEAEMIGRNDCGVCHRTARHIIVLLFVVRIIRVWEVIFGIETNMVAFGDDDQCDLCGTETIDTAHFL